VIGLSLILLFLNTPEPFIVDASTEATYVVQIARPALKLFVDDIGLFARHMPGVVEVKPVGENRYLYRTEKDVALRSAMKVDFLIGKQVYGDTLTVYRSLSPSDENYMSCSVYLHPDGENTTKIRIKLRIRMSRTNPMEVHWMAPIVGAGFISDRMKEDLDEMLASFIETSNKEIYSRYQLSSTN
jgi:hypothetical protein